jgi:hypothetical protein
VVKTRKTACEIRGSSPRLPAFEKWSKNKLKKELRKLDSTISKLRNSWFHPYICAHDFIKFSDTLDERRKIVRWTLKQRCIPKGIG